MRIRCIHTGRCNGQVYQPGALIDMPDAEAMQACASGRFLPDTAPAVLCVSPPSVVVHGPAPTIVVSPPVMRLFHLNRSKVSGDRVIIFTYRATDHYSNKEARFRNIKASLNHYKSMFDAMVIVEHDATPKLTIDDAQIDHLFIRDDGPFNKCQAFNVGWRHAVEKYGVSSVCFCDADIIVTAKTIKNSLTAIKKCAAVNPYSKIIHMNEDQTSAYLESGDFAVAAKYKPSAFTIMFAGGIVFVQTAVLRRVGGWDERFLGWGGEDNAFGNVLQYLYPAGLKTLNETALHLWHFAPLSRAKQQHENYDANTVLCAQSVKEPQLYWQSTKHRANDATVLQKDTRKILILGSGPTAPLVKDLDLSEWYVIAINNAWRLGCWDANIYPVDFPNYPTGNDANGKDIVDHHIYLHVNRKWGDQKQECGYTMSMDAAYYALTLEPEVIAFLGVDMTYKPDAAGNTHFYGKGGPDPLRLGVENLKKFVANFGNRAKEQGVRLYNFSPASQESLLTYDRYDTTKDIDLI